MGALYGRGNYSSGLYGRGYAAGVNYITGLAPTQVWVWDKNMNFKCMYQAGSCDLASIEFTHGVKGCGDFTLQFSTSTDIVQADRIKIRLFNSDQWFYTGVIRSIPEVGSTKKGFEYSGLGYNDYFSRINSGSQSYSNKSLAYIAYDLLNSKLIGTTPILYDAAKMNPPNITLTSLKANYCSVNDVFDALVKIANSTGIEYNIGVDKDSYFFFRPRDPGIAEILTVGTKGKWSIQAYEPESSQDPRTNLIVLDKDGNYLTTVNSLLNNDVYYDKMTAPDIDSATAILWGQGQLAQMERTTLSATVEWPIESYYPDVLIADGFIRVICTIPPKTQITVSGTAWGDGNWGDGLWGGGVAPQWTNRDDTLTVNEVKYKLDSKKAIRTIALGSTPPRLEDVITDIDKKLTSLEVSLGM
jgi:hypothetical protein